MQLYKLQRLSRGCIYTGKGRTRAEKRPENRVHGTENLQHLDENNFPTVVSLPEIYLNISTISTSDSGVPSRRMGNFERLLYCGK